MRYALILLLTLCTDVYSQTYWEGKVTRVKDGDTFEFRLDCEKYDVRFDVRMAGIDAPEHDQPYGDESYKYLRENILGRSVKIVWKYKDRYGRLLGEVYLGNISNVNKMMLRSGYAWYYDYDKRTKISAYKASSDSAFVERKGLWYEVGSDIPPVEPRKFRNEK